jgi:hypothetical protein
MKTLKKVQIIPVFVDQMPDHYDYNHIYISNRYKVAKHICLCGTCDQMTIMPLNYELFPNTHWKLVEETNGTVSFIGSVGNYRFPCKSHYIITNNIANFV